MNKMHCAFIAAAVILSAILSDAVSVSALSEKTSDVTSPVNIQNAATDNTRYLRTVDHVDNDNQPENDSEEDRAFTSAMKKNIIDTWIRQTPIVDKIANEVTKRVKYQKLNEMIFKGMYEAGYTPQKLYTLFEISSKIRNKQETDWVYDMYFVLWMEYSRWWPKRAKNIKSGPNPISK